MRHNVREILFWTGCVGILVIVCLVRDSLQQAEHLPAEAAAPETLIEAVDSGDWCQPIEEPPQIQEFLRLLNTERARQRKPLDTLLNHSLLNVAAQGHAEWMASKKRMSHTGQYRSSFTDRIKGTGYEYSTGGETVACGQRNVPAVFEEWMNSRDHRAILLGPSYEDIGFGFATAKDGTIYWCAVVARPREARKDTP